MDRLLRLDALWNWLPAFRAVGETQHLPSAATALHVSPSALSRSVRLLEQRLGCTLFERRSRSLLLTPKGRQFLDAVRTAMRQLDDAVEDLDQREPRGPLRIASVTAVLVDLVAPAARWLGQRFPDLHPQLLTKVDAIVPRLLAGEIDVAFVHHGITLPGIHCERLALLPRSVYCSAEHPLARLRTIAPEQLADVPFVTATADQLGQTQDGWPAAWPRQVALQTDQLTIGFEMCLAGTMLAVLPDLLAARRGRLHRLPIEGCSALELFAIRRTGETSVGRADARLITAVRERLQVEKPVRGVEQAAT
jgi:DNA-binding transcriptional LysR family regulator